MKIRCARAFAMLIANVVAGCASSVPAVSPTGSPPPTTAAIASPPAASLATGASIVATIPIPNDGPVAYGDDSVWVENREGGAVNDGIPAGVLYRIDPSAGQIIDEIPGVVGGQAAVGEGGVWLVTLAADLDVLTRVDLNDHSVVMIKTALGPDPEPEGVAIVGGGIWVPHAHTGTVVRIDPETYAGTAAIQVAPAGVAGPQGTATNGSSLWVAVPRDATVVRIDVASERVLARVELPAEESAAAGMVADEHALWVTNGPESEEGNLVFRINAETDILEATVDVDATAVDAAIGFGSVWVVTDSPAALVRIDPQTNRVTGRLLLPARAGPTDDDRLSVGLGVAIGDEAIWVRVIGAVLKVMPA